jgi:hypothetical protein
MNGQAAGLACPADGLGQQVVHRFPSRGEQGRRQVAVMVGHTS